MTMISLIEFTLTIGTASLTAAGASHGWRLLRQARQGRPRHQASDQQERETGRPSAGAWHTPRQNHRCHVHCQIDYLTAEGPTGGTLVDLSPQGWRVAGERSVMCGATLSMHVYLPGQSLPLDIEAAIVRWTDGDEFGVELTTLSPEAAARLSDFLQAQVPAHKPGSFYEVSPFSYN